MNRFFKGFRTLAGVSLGALALAGVSPALAAKHHHGKKHHKKVTAAPSDYTLKGLDTNISATGDLGDIKLPSRLKPAEVLARFGAPGPASFNAETITKLGDAIIAIHYPYNSSAGVTFNWTPSGELDTLAISSPAYHTTGGVHVGSSTSEVQAAFPKATCDQYYCVQRNTDEKGTVNVLSFDIVDGKVIQMNLSARLAS